ncbi:Ger(x)C family spore germination protein [Halobacillus litoralis]|uniref:Ger(x)C family spore germination protein n=1 Tax=Halobacillus litoralis TaxID=45668 RepID=UPI001CD6E72F|nr:Ger(x)C family spore germination protein [Halobacillus litoralis]MCA1020494.1 Ger(x)C family spore germination protein [Halobacillus litoralis]
MNIKWKFFVFLGILLLSAGCVPSKSVEENAIVQISGYDRGGDGGRIKGTVSIPQYGKSEKKTAASELYLTVDANSIKDVEKEIQKKSSKPISIGKLAVTLYSMELAEEGISDVIDVLSRDARLSRNMYLAVVDGQTQDLIENGYTQDETTSKHLQGLIENNVHHNFPSTSLHEFLYAYYAIGMDPYLPILEQKESFVEISGIGFFKKGKLVTTLSDAKVFTFKMMKENFTRGMQDLPFQDGTIMLDNIGSTVDYKLTGTDENPGLEINVKLKSEVNEMVGVEEKPSPQLAKEMEDAFVDYFKTNADEMIELFKKEGIDPLGLGHFAKTRTRHFDEKRWEDLYPDMDIQFDVDVEITEYGIFS